MTMKMMDNIINKFGFEDSRTLAFCEMVNRGDNMIDLCIAYDEYMNTDIMLDE